MEVWKDVVGFEGLYQVSNTGIVKSLSRVSLNEGSYSGSIKVKGRNLIQSVNRLGYHVLTLFKDGKRHFKIVHRIVAEAFIENPCRHPEVNHKDLNKSNNSVENLEWCDRSYNVNHMFDNKIKSSKYKGVSYSADRGKWCAYINILGKRIAIGRYSTEEEAKERRDEFITNLKNINHEAFI